MLHAILIKINLTRLEQKLTQRYMASQLGITQSYYNKIEGGKKQLTVQTFLKIAEILNIQPSELLTSANNLTSISNLPSTAHSKN